jgi:hypothetical protein
MHYYALQIFAANVDWPSNNVEIWRYFPTEAEKNDPNLHPHLRDGRWRFKAQDFEYGFGLWSGGDPVPSGTDHVANTLHALINRTGTDHSVTQGGRGYHFNATQSASWVMPALLQREDMRAKLGNALSDIMEGSHSAALARSTFDRMRAPMLPEHSHMLSIARISELPRNGAPSVHGFSGVTPDFPRGMDQINSPDASIHIPAFIQGRHSALQGHMARPYTETTSMPGAGLGLTWASRTATTLTVGSGGTATLNTRVAGFSESPVPGDPRTARTVTGQYFAGVDIPVTVNPWQGYILDAITVNGSAVTPQNDHGRIFANVQPGATVNVTFRKDPSITHPTINRVQARAQNWFEITNYTDSAVSTRGLYLSDNYDRDDERIRTHDFRFRMPAVIIRPGESVMMPLSSGEAEEMLKWTQLSFGLRFGERFRLADARGNILQHIEVSLMGVAQIQQRGEDGAWRIVDGPCRDCARCGCMQCFGANGGNCNLNTCSRCWCSAPLCNRLVADCICGPQEGRPLITGDGIEGVTVTTDGNIAVTGIGMPGHGGAINFVVQIRLPGEFRMDGFSGPPGITWSVSGDILTITASGTVQWGSGLGSMWGQRDGW